VGLDSALVFGQGMSFPPHVGRDGRIAWSNGELNIRESIQVILMTEPRERLNAPDFGGGLGRFLFEPNTTTTRRSIQDRILKSLGRWEPRIAVEGVEVEADAGDPAAAVATITYRLLATQTLQRLSLQVSLGRGA
jgi:phage baseplate assembly protein W